VADLSVVIPYTLQDEHLLVHAVASVDMDCEVITFCDTERLGAGWARNQGVAQASHDWIVKLDSDDFLDPGSLAALWEMRGKRWIVATASAQFERDGELLHRWDYEDVSDAAILTMMRTPASAGTLLYHRTVGSYPENCGAYEGWAFVCRAIRDGFHVATAEGTCYRHRIRDGSYWPTRHEHRREDLRNAFAYVNEMYAEAVDG
jgi:glycosyltransferase involved in cell wall biosynthesis